MTNKFFGSKKVNAVVLKAGLVISGVSVCLVFLEVFLRLSGGAISFFQEYRNRLVSSRKSVYTIMCVGESSTAIGGSSSYPDQLEDILNQRSRSLKFRVINKGVSTVDTNYILEHLQENIKKHGPDMVIAMMGINDKYVKYYEGIPDTGSLLFRYSAVYRFFKLVALNIEEKVKGPGIARGTSPVVFDAAAEGDCLKEGALERIAHGQAGDDDYIQLGRFYRKKGQYSLSEDAFRKAIGLNPGNSSAYVDLGWLYTQDKRYSDAKQSFVKALEIDPAEKSALFGYGIFCSSRTAYRRAEGIFKQLISVDPEDEKAYVELGWVYMRVGKYSQAEEILKGYLRSHPESVKIYAALSVLYREAGRPDLAEESDKKISSLEYKTCSALTRYNYRRLKEMLGTNGVKLVCLGYPLRSVEVLKDIFGNSPEVLIVSNEQVFKEALEHGRYRDYFLDMFGGNFGHCRRKGNALIAGNLADKILKSLGLDTP